MRWLAITAFGLWALAAQWRNLGLRVYLIAFLIGTALAEGWLSLGGRDDDPAYHYIYFWAILSTTGVACWLGNQMRPSPLAGLAGFAIAPFAADNMVMWMQGVWLSIPAVQLAGTTFGSMLTAQSVWSLAYAYGQPINPSLWNWLGEWVPAAIIVLSFTGLIRSKTIC